jgi:hypothetical protein
MPNNAADILLPTLLSLYLTALRRIGLILHREAFGISFTSQTFSTTLPPLFKSLIFLLPFLATKFHRES